MRPAAPAQPFALFSHSSLLPIASPGQDPPGTMLRRAVLTLARRQEVSSGASCFPSAGGLSALQQPIM